MTMLIPTSLLACFGLLAVRSEKTIVEKNMVQKYKAMADVVEGQIKEALSSAPEEQLADAKQWDALLADQATIFGDEVIIFDHHDQPLLKGHGPAVARRSLTEAVFTRPLANLPYTIGVYERYPIILEQLKERLKALVLYVILIGFSVVLILIGGFYTLGALRREWRFAQLKSEFVEHLSHDLRRPLTSIQMFSEMLKDGHVPSEDKKQEYYQIIATESDKLSHLANNILDFSRIERGRIRYHFEKSDICSLARDTIQRFEAYIADPKRPLEEKKRKVTLTTKNCPLIKMDSSAIGQALMNLLTNAAKYSPAHTPIHVNVSPGPHRWLGCKPTHSVMIEVIDQGYGIPTSEQKKIFQKFYRVPSHYVSQTEGSGLGLTLVQYAIEAHKGKVLVESQEGKGSKFTIILPADRQISL